MIDLNPARLAVEALLTDEGVVERDRPGVADDVLDDATGQLVRPPGDSADLWTGPILVTPETRQAPEGIVSPLDAVVPLEAAYRGLLPLAAPPIRAGDELRVTVARRDPQLAGRRFRVVSSPELSTFALVRIVGLELLP